MKKIQTEPGQGNTLAFWVTSHTLSTVLFLFSIENKDLTMIFHGDSAINNCPKGCTEVLFSVPKASR